VVQENPYRLDDRTIIVTGASRGIGAAVAHVAARQGANLVLVARSGDALEAVGSGLDTQVRTVVGDVGDTETAERALDAAEDIGTRVWGLVNNAGINPFYKPTIDTPLHEWDDVLRVNLLGAAIFARAVGRIMVDQGGGRIVNLGSIAGLTGLPNIGPYNASKAAIDAMTRTLAVELGPSGVLVNSVAPGTIRSEMVDDLLVANPALADRLVAKAPLGRVGDLHEAAEPIVFLLTDAASFITGHVLVVDGGRLAAG
jgi:NAD(P)-dependent dehydrogenase (short-subunit alcohol dehydrogenase family)